jgi:sterol desaturase/sphingolipid hydroxylase (fatty acid hydroxylase superfamily)
LTAGRFAPLSTTTSQKGTRRTSASTKNKATKMILSTPVERAIMAAAALLTSHVICTLIIMYHDLSGKWKNYALVTEKRTIGSYLHGLKSFMADITVMFIPFMTCCFSYRQTEINTADDSIGMSLLKLVCGYWLGKLWATAVHYALHLPSLYRFHKRHHSMTHFVATKAWEDSWVEYMVMEIPSFAIAVLVFPTHFQVHLLHFIMHGYDGASNHSGFAAPGLLGYLFDGEYHYYHRK